MEHNSQKSRLPILLRHVVLGFDGRTLCVLFVQTNGVETTDWQLVGGPLPDDENLDRAATRILFDQTGLQEVPVEQLFTADEVYRTSEQRTVTVVYQVQLPITAPINQVVRSHMADWFSIRALPRGLSIDQTHLIEQVIDRLQTKATLQPVGFDMLPPSFTIGQLQLLYEAIFNTDINKTAFEKRLLATGLLIASEPVNRYSALDMYRLDNEKYESRFMPDWNFSSERDTFLP